MIKNKTLNLDQWENEFFLGATDLTPELLEVIRAGIVSYTHLKSLSSVLTSDIQSTEEEWMFI